MEETENIVKYDSGVDAGDNRIIIIIIIICTNRNLAYLASSSELYGDGTFKVAPTIFQQLYTIHGFVVDSLQPLIYALLQAKNTETYSHLLTEVTNLIDNLDPIRFMCDFELALINSVYMVSQKWL